MRHYNNFSAVKLFVTLPHMSAEERVPALETENQQLRDRVHVLEEENQQLRDRVRVLEDENRRLHDRLERLEQRLDEMERRCTCGAVRQVLQQQVSEKEAATAAFLSTQ